MELVERVAEAANVSPGWILTGEGPMRPDTTRQALTEEMAAEVGALLARIGDDDVLRLCGVDRAAVQAQIDARLISPAFVLSMLQFLGIPLQSSGVAAGPMERRAVVPPPTKHGPVPVVVLREAGMGDWYSPDILEAKTERPDVLLAPDAFCVEVHDQSLERRGLWRGVKVFCDPLYSYQERDVVYVETTRKGEVAAALRVVDGIYEAGVGFGHWRQAGAEEAYVREFIPFAELLRVAVVALIRTRP